MTMDFHSRPALSSHQDLEQTWLRARLVCLGCHLGLGACRRSSSLLKTAPSPQLASCSCSRLMRSETSNSDQEPLRQCFVCNPREYPEITRGLVIGPYPSQRGSVQPMAIFRSATIMFFTVHCQGESILFLTEWISATDVRTYSLPSIDFLNIS
jgi:hypothetical protein